MSLSLTLACLLVGGWLGGRLAKLLGLPGVLGMLVWGLGFGALAGPWLPASLAEISPFLKSLALVVILLRAGLGLKKADLRIIGLRAFLLGLLPLTFEVIALSLVFALGLGWDGLSAFLAAAILTALSPAVVVPTMLEYQKEGWGEAKRLPSTLLAGASLDNVLALALISLSLEVHQAGSLNLEALVHVPVNLAGGIAPGLLLGFGLAWFFNHQFKVIRATEKTMILLGLMLILLQLGEVFHSSAVLGVLSVGLILMLKTPEIAAETSTKLAKLWIAAEIVLFGLIGLALPVSGLLPALGTGLLLLATGLGIRALTVLIVTRLSGLTWRESLFCVLANLPKATIQAAFAGVPLSLGLAHGQEILTFGVLAILITSPLGLISLNLWGKKLLGPEIR